ncbi:hypothetical protein B0J11DRAFT_586809 [Dendryphion nanum]|uniref:F-box domain-containing protein n=1 Tax=Dendryphion nanum TaxID=256645 RepID=A0A9P9I6E6_9PLEO|nr:hypothetical protein B0J11DRAFT_586809 [Dendryphion nanum]
MPTSLDRLPFDVLFNISEYLEFDEIIQLCQTCRQLNLLLAESSLCWKMIRDHAPHSKEARLARNGHLTFAQAAKNLYSRRHAFSRAMPFSARSLGRAHAFIYHQGVLCVLNGSMIQVSDIHNSKELVRIDVHSTICTFGKVSSPVSQFHLLYYADNLLAIHQEGKRRMAGHIWLVSTEPAVPKQERLKRKIALRSRHKLFARHTSSFLYFGTYTGINDRSGGHQWEIHGVSLDPSLPVDTPYTKPLQLEGFLGCDIGSTVAFEIHNGYFYAVSNQIAMDIEEIDWTSFYHVIRFPIESPVTEAVEMRDDVYRRHHSEGPINNSWTDLSIQVDEKTNRPIIVEARKEWQNGSSRQSRAFYMSEIRFDYEGSGLSTREPEGLGSRNKGKSKPKSSAQSWYSDCRPNDMPDILRKTWQVHPEFGPHCTNARAFFLSRTKFRGYNYSAKSFVDLVEDDGCCPMSHTPCIRLRVGTRQPAPCKQISRLIDLPSIQDPEEDLEQDRGEVKSDVQHRQPEIAMWPPSMTCPCAVRLHSIISPVSERKSIRNITSIIDDYSLVYMIKNRTGRGYGADDASAMGDLVLVSFSRDIKVPDMSIYGLETEVEETDRDVGGGRKESDVLKEWKWQPGQFSQCQQRTCV